jgi:hypothetical protein
MPKKSSSSSESQASRLLKAARAARNSPGKAPFAQAMGKNTMAKQARKATRVG